MTELLTPKQIYAARAKDLAVELATYLRDQDEDPALCLSACMQVVVHMARAKKVSRRQLKKAMDECWSAVGRDIRDAAAKRAGESPPPEDEIDQEDYAPRELTIADIPDAS